MMRGDVRPLGGSSGASAERDVLPSDLAPLLECEA